MGTSDIHSHAVNWDYYKDAAYSDSAGNVVGLARVSSLVKQIRADRGRERTLLFDAGDTIQGTPLGFYYATVEPITKTGQIHPMARQMNALGFDAVALGNHEFNYGLPFLDKWISQMDAPVLGANAVHAGTDRPAFRPYIGFPHIATAPVVYNAQVAIREAIVRTRRQPRPSTPPPSTWRTGSWSGTVYRSSNRSAAGGVRRRVHAVRIRCAPRVSADLVRTAHPSRPVGRRWPSGGLRLDLAPLGRIRWTSDLCDDFLDSSASARIAGT